MSKSNQILHKSAASDVLKSTPCPDIEMNEIASNNFVDFEFEFAPREILPEIYETLASLPRISFRKDSKIPPFAVKIAENKYKIKYEFSPSIFGFRNDDLYHRLVMSLEDRLRKTVNNSPLVRETDTLVIELNERFWESVGLINIDKDIQNIVCGFLAGIVVISNKKNHNGKKLFYSVSYKFANFTLATADSRSNGIRLEARLSTEYLRMLSVNLLSEKELNFLISLGAIHRRWLEVVKYLKKFRTKEGEALTIGYDEFTKWMAIDKMPTVIQIESQLQEINAPFIKSNYISHFCIEERKSSNSSRFDLNYKFNLDWKCLKLP